MRLGDPERDGKIVQMVALPDGLYSVAERAIYRAVLADNIDPDFSHPNTPHVNQKFAGAGADNPIVSQTLLQAAHLFSSQHFDELTCEQALKSVVAGMQELLGAEDILLKLQRDLKSTEVDLLNHHDGTMALPSVGDIEVRGKAFIQRAEHALQALYQLAVVFFDDNRKPGFFDGVAQHVRTNFSDHPEFVVFADSLAKLAKLIRGLRHSIEHRNPNQQLDFLDYHFDAGRLHRPGMRVVHPDVPFEPTPLDVFMKIIIADLLEAFESLIVFLAAVHVTSFGKLKVTVGRHPRFGENDVRVKFTYFIAMGDPPRWHLLG
tara:strand:- start:11026 stop:11982 length:957 start_codon:yes stop_codon:yes gene_type:complete